MLLKNITENNFITIKGIAGKNIQTKPGKVYEVTDKVGKGLLNNYAHIFKKIETEGDANAKLKAENVRLKADILEKDKKIKFLLSKADEKDKLKKEEEIKKIDEELIKLQKKYIDVLKKDKVPTNKKNDKERLKSKIEEAKK